MKKCAYFLLIPCFSLLLTACAASRPAQPTPTIVSTDDATTRLADAASTISHSLDQLAQLQKAVTPAGKPLPDAEMPGLQNLVSVDWTGPIEPIVAKIANDSHYTFRVLGNAPAIPIIVAVTAHETPAGKILRDIDFQAGAKAEVAAYPTKGVIELRYNHT